jgi:hypothetical protein
MKKKCVHPSEKYDNHTGQRISRNSPPFMKPEASHPLDSITLITFGEEYI